ncbi:MAG: hypothetical protein JOS17DRAFT_766051 [Linnemannia elongata]|nr:MAG: hypothetical protein JOS17DRAFT_766051 [Linnemannia elongata]
MLVLLDFCCCSLFYCIPLTVVFGMLLLFLLSSLLFLLLIPFLYPLFSLSLSFYSLSPESIVSLMTVALSGPP